MCARMFGVRICLLPNVRGNTHCAPTHRNQIEAIDDSLAFKNRANVHTNNCTFTNTLFLLFRGTHNIFAIWRHTPDIVAFTKYERSRMRSPTNFTKTKLFSY